MTPKKRRDADLTVAWAERQVAEGEERLGDEETDEIRAYACGVLLSRL